MIQYLNQNTVANDVRMRRQEFRGSFILVEGRSDQKLYSKFVDRNRCQVILCRTRDDVIAAVSILENDNFLGFIAIIDADFDHLDGTHHISNLIFLTDTHDAETMILRTDAFESVLCEFCSPDKRTMWERKFQVYLRDHLLSESSKIGFALWYSKQQKLNLTFKNLNPSIFFDDDTLTVSIPKLAHHIHEKSGHPFAPTSNLEKGISDLQKIGADLWHIARGHDFIKLLSCALRRAIGTCKQNDVSNDILESHLRTAYTFAGFSHTNLYTSVRAWASNCHTFQFFC